MRGLQTRRGGVRVRRRRRVSRGQLCLHLHTYTCLHYSCLHYTCLLCTPQRVCGQTERRTVVPRDILQVGRDTCNSGTAARVYCDTCNSTTAARVYCDTCTSGTEARVYCVGTGTSTAAPAPASRRAAAHPTGDTALPGHGPGAGADGHHASV